MIYEHNCYNLNVNLIEINIKNIPNSYFSSVNNHDYLFQSTKYCEN